MEREQLIELCDNGKIHLSNHLLETVGAFDKPTVIWTLPPLGSNVLILEHITSDRKKRETTLYGLETEGNRRFIVYKVKEYTVSQDKPYDSRNFVVLQYQIGKKIWLRRIPTREFACGYYEAEILSEEDVREVEKYRAMYEGKV